MRTSANQLFGINADNQRKLLKHYYPSFHLFLSVTACCHTVELRVPTTGGAQPASVTRACMLAILKKKVHAALGDLQGSSLYPTEDSALS